MRYLFVLFLPLALFVFPTSSDTGGSNQNEKCYYCHKLKASYKVVHKIMEEGCEVCHEPLNTSHPGDEPGFKLVAEGPDLCLICHDLGDAKHTHPPASEDCLICHSPHSSQYPSLLVDDPPSSLCYMCHENVTEKAKDIHLPVKNGQCQLCHDPHRSANNALLRSEGPALCLSCHNKTMGDDTVIITNIAQLVSEKKYVHGAIEMSGCIGCHTPHASKYPGLLVAAFPKGAYTASAPENFELCFSCHDSQLITATKTNSATNFRNGEENLHFKHVHGNKGRSCTLCHNVHAADNVHLINESVTFGKWQMQLNYKSDPQGGSCLPGCHGKATYNRIL
ncbi:MAG: cytochrome C [Chlorobi bacterium]|nr:cytochrome C [Chlorobiota bacterium]